VACCNQGAFVPDAAVERIGVIHTSSVGRH
jgi:hypothetical protein